MVHEVPAKLVKTRLGVRVGSNRRRNEAGCEDGTPADHTRPANSNIYTNRVTIRASELCFPITSFLIDYFFSIFLFFVFF